MNGSISRQNNHRPLKSAEGDSHAGDEVEHQQRGPLDGPLV